ncbi:MAG: hypothetical protein ABSF71_15755 [Terriglobia bacterium]|jgi:hypothetical protein
MPSQKASNLRPLRQIRHAFDNPKVTRGDGLEIKVLMYDVRSRNVYENKQNNDKIPDEKSDIYGKVTRILQKIAHLEGQFATNGAFATCFVRNFVPICRRERKMEVC